MSMQYYVSELSQMERDGKIGESICVEIGRDPHVAIE